MELFENDWAEKLAPLIKIYKGKKHPLNYDNLYQLMVAVILSAQDSDANINKIAPAFFEVYPTLESLAASNRSSNSFISKVRNFNTKAGWLIEIAQTLKKDSNIPTKLDDLIALKGIGESRPMSLCAK